MTRRRPQAKLPALAVLGAVLAIAPLPAPRPAAAQSAANAAGAPSSPAPRWGRRHRAHVYGVLQATGLAVVADATLSPIGGHIGHGGGPGIVLGVRLGPYASLEAGFVTTFNHDPWDDILRRNGKSYRPRDFIYTMIFSADLKLHVPTFGPLEPFFQIGGGYAFVGADYPEGTDEGAVFARGGAWNVGGGFDWWLGKRIALTTRVLYRGIAFGEPLADPGTAGGGKRYPYYANTIGLDVGLMLHY